MGLVDKVMRRLAGKQSSASFNNSFFIAGDEWALSMVLPEENTAHCRKIASKAHKHLKEGGDDDEEEKAEEDRIAITEPYVIEHPPHPIGERKLTLGELESLFDGVLVEADSVLTSKEVLDPAYEQEDGFAFICEAKPSAGFYGTIDANGVVKELCYSCDPFPADLVGQVAKQMVKLGDKHKLILFHYGTVVLPLHHEELVTAFLAGNRERYEALLSELKH